MFKKSIIFISGCVLAHSVLAAGVVRNELVAETVFTSFDTETTGFSREKDRLVEIGVVKFRGDGTVLSATNWLVNPQRKIPYPATQVHHITDEMAAQAPLFEAVWPEFEAFCRDTVLLAHNAKFDVGFLKAELERAGIQAPPLPVADTLPLFRKWFPHEESYSLGKLTESLGVAGETYHRAEADSFHVINVFSKGMQSRMDMNMRRFMQDAGGLVWLDGKNRR
jgi:DNA polymerase III epsilon subunit family exonuclease